MTYCRCPEDAAVLVEPSLGPNVVTMQDEIISFAGACLKCGVLAHDPSKTLRNDYRLRLLVGSQFGNYRVPDSPYWLPRWDEDVLFLAPRKVKTLEYLRGWRKRPIPLVQGEALGRLNLKSHGRWLPEIDGVPPVQLLPDVVRHVFVRLPKLTPNSQDNHVQPLPLLEISLTEPDEVWQHDFTDLSGVCHKDQICYLKRYVNGQERFTHFAVADAALGFVRTAYRLEPLQQIPVVIDSSRRFGVFLYASYWIKP